MALAVNVTVLLLGALSHLLYFKRGEHHIHALRYVLAFVLLNIFSVYALSYLTGSDVGSATKLTLSAASYYLLGTYSSLLIYRACFHRLNKFPGPFLARLSSFWFSSKVIGSADAPEKLLKLHEKYGAFLRIGSNDISVIHPDAPNAIYGSRSNCSKGTWYDLDHPTPTLHTTRNKVLHDKRRRIWSPAFSDKSLRGYEIRMKPYGEKLVKQLEAFGGKPVNASEWFNYFSYDIMGDLAFGDSFGMLDGGEEHWAIKLLNEGMDSFHVMFSVWFHRILISIPGLAKNYWRFINYCSSQLDKRMEKTPPHPDIMSSLLQPYQKPGKGLEKPTGVDLALLRADSRLIIVAGSDTSAVTLTHLFYHIASDKGIAGRIREELGQYVDAEGEAKNADIAHCDYLNGCISETLRLHPPVPTRIPRITPPEGIQIGGEHIPGGVDIWCPQYVVGRNEAAYKNAHDFVPDRWYSRPELVTEKSAWAPFSLGAFGCIGKPLALLEIRTIAARILFNFDVELAPGEDGSDLLYKSRDHFTVGLAPLRLVFRKRTASRDGAAT